MISFKKTKLIMRVLVIKIKINSKINNRIKIIKICNKITNNFQDKKRRKLILINTIFQEVII